MSAMKELYTAYQEEMDVSTLSTAITTFLDQFKPERMTINELTVAIEECKRLANRLWFAGTDLDVERHRLQQAAPDHKPRYLYKRHKTTKAGN